MLYGRINIELIQIIIRGNLTVTIGVLWKRELALVEIVNLKVGEGT